MSNTSTGVHHRLAARAVIATLALSALFVTGPAFGQGTSGTLPGPISSRDLATWADQLELGDEAAAGDRPAFMRNTARRSGSCATARSSSTCRRSAA